MPQKEAISSQRITDIEDARASFEEEHNQGSDCSSQAVGTDMPCTASLRRKASKDELDKIGLTSPEVSCID